MKLKTGYNVFITSWQNDGDDYNTVVYNTTDPEVVQGIVDSLKIFKESHRKEGFFGNIFDGELPMEAVDLVFPFMERYWGDSIVDDEEGRRCSVEDFLWDMGIFTGDWVRICDKIQVFFVDSFEDMTGDFVK